MKNQNILKIFKFVIFLVNFFPPQKVAAAGTLRESARYKISTKSY